MAARQGRLPGISPKQIPEIEDAAEELRSLRKQRQALGVEEEKAQVLLRDLLKKHGIRKAYVYEGEDDEGKPVALDALVETADERAYVRRHKEPKKKAADSEPPVD